MSDQEPKPLIGATLYVFPDKQRIAELAVRAAETKRRALGFPIVYCPTEVRLQGEALDEPVLWIGRQWAVTAYGVEARDGTYAIESSRLNEDADTWPWERHMAEKGRVDVDDFRTAIMWARGAGLESDVADADSPG